MRRRLLWLLPLSLVACSGPRGASSFPPSYIQSDRMPPALPSCAAPLGLDVADARTDTTSVGRRFWEEHPNQDYPIRLDGKADAFIQQGLERALVRAGHPVQAGNAKNLTVKVTQLAVEEKVFRNSEYDGLVTLEVALGTPGSEQPCWTGRIRGVSENYGKAGSAVNYQETLSRALDHAASELFGNADFAKALCGKCAATPASGPTQTL
jgi:hypothetical protein